ncbi:MAG: DMT family transporter [Acidobacteria bacterium]|nr:DMT family transporter [Acidobacteriota bacterium]
MKSHPRAALQLVAAAVLFSTGGAAIKATALTSWQVASFRSGIAAVAVLLMSRAARTVWRQTPAERWRAVLVGVAYAATLVLFVLANKLTTSANTIFLQSTSPLYLLILGPLLLKEPIQRQDIAFMAAVGVGLILFFVGTDRPYTTAPNPGRGNLLAALSGLSWAFTICGLRWMGTATRDGAASAIGAVVTGNLIAFLVGLPMALPASGHGLQDWIVVLYLGVFQIALAYVLVAGAIPHLSVLEASVLLLVEPALNPIWAWLVHGETPGAWALVGGVMILGATTLKTYMDARQVEVVT